MGTSRPGEARTGDIGQNRNQGTNRDSHLLDNMIRGALES